MKNKEIVGYTIIFYLFRGPETPDKWIIIGISRKCFLSGAGADQMEQNLMKNLKTMHGDR